MGSGNVHTVINVLAVAGMALIALRYSQEVSQLIGSGTAGINSVYLTAIGVPNGQALPAVPR